MNDFIMDLTQKDQEKLKVLIKRSKIGVLFCIGLIFLILTWLLWVSPSSLSVYYSFFGFTVFFTIVGGYLYQKYFKLKSVLEISKKIVRHGILQDLKYKGKGYYSFYINSDKFYYQHYGKFNYKNGDSVTVSYISLNQLVLDVEFFPK